MWEDCGKEGKGRERGGFRYVWGHGYGSGEGYAWMIGFQGEGGIGLGGEKRRCAS